jgi:hypothetical protein
MTTRIPHICFAALLALAPGLTAQDTPPMPKALDSAAATAEGAAPSAHPAGTTMEQVLAEQEAARKLVESTNAVQSGPIPRSYPLERYSILWQRSPFEMDIIINTPPPPEPPFKDYALLGVMEIGNVKSASFFNKAENKSLVVSTEPRSKDPFKLLDIAIGKDLASTTVKVSSSGQEGTIAYDPEVSKQRRASGGGGGGAAPQGGNPGAPNPPQPNQQQRQDAGTPNRPGGNPPGQPVARNPGRTNSAPRGNQPTANNGNNNNPAAQGNGQRPPRRRVIIPRQVPSQR